VKALFRKFWSVLAVLAGLLLIYFEYRRAHGVTADNAFWLFVGVLIVILGTLNLFQPPSTSSSDSDKTLD